MSHISNPEADALLDIPIKVLDWGEVVPVDFMGGDIRVCQAARISYAKDLKNSDLEGNKKLIFYMMKNGHTSPFEQCEVTFRIKLPIFVMRQLIRHRTANVNEMSARYTELPEVYYIPKPENLFTQDKKNKQGRSISKLEDSWMITALQVTTETAFTLYHKLLQACLARELARIILPLNVYTECYWKMDLHNLFHLLKLRMDEHAQWEIREYANAMASFVKVAFPMCWEAFEEFELYSVKLSRSDSAILDEVKK